MKLLLITTLYPAYVNQSKTEATYAVHYFAKEWVKENDVQVMRLWPSYPKFFRFFNKVKKNIMYSFEDSFMIDRVNVKRILIKKIPKVEYMNKDIYTTAKKIIENTSEMNTPDIIICDILNPSIYIGEIVAKAFNSKLVASLHNSDILYLANSKKYKKYIRTDPYVHKIVFRSDKVEKHFMEIYRGEKNINDFATILFGIEKKDIVDKEKLENEINKKMKEIIVACSLKKLKKVDIIIKAFSELNNRDSYVLRIIGDGPERKTLEELTDSLGCRNYVLFEGEKKREEVLHYMEQADIFAMVSSPETFGLVYIEAMAKGCITVGSRGEGIDGVIVDNKNGFLCKPDSINDLKTTLERIMKLNQKEKYRILNNAIITVEDLTYEKLASKFLYEVQ